MSATPLDPVGSTPPVIDFSRLWQTGRVRGVEDYLARQYPDGVETAELLDLVQQEVLLRETRGEVPDPAEYRRRFPDHADQIGALFAVNQLLCAQADGDPSHPAIPGYEVGESLGRGGTGEVFRATDAVLGRPIAVKVLRREWRDDTSLVGRFWGEARITARLQHPGVAPLYEAGYDERERPFIAMKLVEGRTLARLLADRASPADDLPRLVHVFEQVCQTVAYAHAKGVVHRDLKPANVMVGEFGEVQVMDWGLAKQLTDKNTTAMPEVDPPSVDLNGSTAQPVGLTLAGQTIGTPAYAPPEQARGDHERVGSASDVFGLGAVLCEVLTGHPPFDSVEQARAGDVGPALVRLRESATDAELAELAARCLAPDPDDRPADAAAVAAAMDGYQTRLRERLRQAELAEARSASERRARRRTEVLRLIGVAVLVAVGVGAWAWSQWQADLARDVSAAVEEGWSAREEMVRVGGDPARLAEAERAARRAEGLLRGVVGRAELRRQVSALLADLEADARDPAMVRRLDEIRMSQDTPGRVSSAGAVDAKFAATFRDYGIDAPALAPDEAARRLNRRAPREALVAALDYWGHQCLTHPPLEPRGRHLLAVAAAADPDPWRNRLRAALLARDTKAVMAMASEALTADLPTQTLIALGTVVASRSMLEPGARAPARPRPEALAVLREARRRAPADFWANFLLASALNGSNRPGEAVPYYTVALAMRPDSLDVRRRLAVAYLASGGLPAAIRVKAEAVAGNPRDPAAHVSLGRFLLAQGEAERAIYHFQEALRIDPAFGEAMGMLPTAWYNVGAWGEALASHERVLAARPPHPTLLTKYAEGLRRVGRFGDAVAALRQVHRESQKSSGSAEKLQAMERDAALDRRLPRLDDGVFSPHMPAQAWHGVRVCYYSRRDRTAVRLAELAMGDAVGQAAAPGGPNAPMCHVYAAARLGSATDTDATERARCRELALSWLRFELTRQRANARSDDPQKWLAARKTVRLWQQHRDLAPVRDAAALAALTEPERAGWTAFWNEVEDLVRQIDAAGSPGSRRQQ